MAVIGIDAWQIGAAANLLIAACYFAICWTIVRGLIATNQLRTNKLGSATALIFLSCAVHHGSHSVHMLLPIVTEAPHGLAMRDAFSWQMNAWDIFGAAVACVYLSLRSSYGRLLQTPSMFEDLASARVQEAVGAERAALAEAQAVGQMGSFRKDLATGASETSKELRRMFDLADGESTQTIHDAIHPDDVASVREAMLATQRDETADVVYRWLRPSDGAEFFRHLRARAEHGADGSVVTIAGTVQDVTERSRMEAALRDAEQRFRTAFDHAPIGVSLVALDAEHPGRLVQVNPAMATLVGATVEDLTGSSISSLTHPGDDADVLAELTGLAEGRTHQVEIEKRLMHRQGYFVWALITASLLTDAEGRLSLAVAHVMDISERKQHEGQLQHLADHDALTGLYNRRRFTEELERALRHTKRYGDGGAVLFLDLDGFKFVNDSLGHAAGDDLITRVGSLLHGSLRETDVLARVGGDEFAVLLPKTDEASAGVVADKLLTAVRRHGVAVTADRHAQISTSIGIATFTAGDDLTADEVVVEADIAMYDAKEAGKDRSVLYDRTEGRRARISVRENWNHRLRDAVEHDRFVLLAQPIVPICSNGTERFELLLRLPDDHGDLIPPGTFLYNAERFGFIVEIDHWVLRQGVRLLHDSQAAGADVSLSVNVSGKTMGDPLLGAYVAGLLDEHAIDPSRLVLEITETAAITNIERARTLASELRSLGCQMALDDFGAGFASFYYLKHLEFDLLKIDGEFIRNLCATPADQLVVRAVVDIAKGLGTKTIAEFVGDDETLALLCELGVDYGQGYHLGRPVALEQALPHLAATRA